MDELWKNDIFREKVKGLSPPVKKYFLDSLNGLFEQETKVLIDVLEDCRYDLRLAALQFQNDAEEDRARSRMLEERREKRERSKSRGHSRNSSRISYINEKERAEEFMRRRSLRRKIALSDENRSASSLSVPEYGSRRSVSPDRRSIRSLPMSPAPDSKEGIAQATIYEQETRAILSSMHHMDASIERERDRQKQVMEERKDKIRQQKMDKMERAMELLEEALKMDKILAQAKEKQAQLTRERILELKQRIANKDIPKTPEPVA
ncbi:uncharacterized protein LOC121376091 [Gigantopelta aegis]|uniref:uncharacterized protein LOC121376091 n=1 Tax=Gigantopelta aegis TaxID=1735272 RepID=UPI001B88A96B|nr:uncharacterized protein LOC121376091 [Gigantopelta aegis]